MCNKSRADGGEEISYSRLASVLLDFGPLVAEKKNPQTFINGAVYQRDCGPGIFFSLKSSNIYVFMHTDKNSILNSFVKEFTAACQIVASSKDQDSRRSEDVFCFFGVFFPFPSFTLILVDG